MADDNHSNAPAPRTDFYVYVLFRENGQPFYVGKGCNGRWLQHEKAARNGERSHRAAIIRKMQARGFKVPKIKLHEGLTETTAYTYEVALVAAIGRADNSTGPLTNLTAAGKGGLDPSSETRALQRAAKLGRRLSAESIAKREITRKLRGIIPFTPEARAKAVATKKARGIKPSPEQVAKWKATRRARDGFRITPEHRAKLSAASKGKLRPAISAVLRGRKQSPEWIAKRAAAKRGQKLSLEAIAKRTATRRARDGYAAPNRGKKLSPEAITKRTETRRRRRQVSR